MTKMNMLLLISLFFVSKDLISMGTNQLEELPETFLETNKLEELPEAFLQNDPALQNLYLGNYQLTELPEAFLQTNQLAELPETFLQNAPALQNLYLGTNQLTELPETFLRDLLSKEEKAILNGDVEGLKNIIKKNPEYLNKRYPPVNDTLLIFAARNNADKKIIKFLLNEGADHCIKNLQGEKLHNFLDKPNVKEVWEDYKKLKEYEINNISLVLKRKGLPESIIRHIISPMIVNLECKEIKQEEI